MSADVTIQFRGQTVTVTDISAFEDRSVGIGWHVEDFRLVGPDGEPLPDEVYDTLTEKEYEAVDNAVLDAERAEHDAYMAAHPDLNDEEAP